MRNFLSAVLLFLPILAVGAEELPYLRFLPDYTLTQEWRGLGLPTIWRIEYSPEFPAEKAALRIRHGESFEKSWPLAGKPGCFYLSRQALPLREGKESSWLELVWQLQLGVASLKLDDDGEPLVLEINFPEKSRLRMMNIIELLPERTLPLLSWQFPYESQARDFGNQSGEGWSMAMTNHAWKFEPSRTVTLTLEIEGITEENAGNYRSPDEQYLEKHVPELAMENDLPESARPDARELGRINDSLRELGLAYRYLERDFRCGVVTSLELLQLRESELLLLCSKFRLFDEEALPEKWRKRSAECRAELLQNLRSQQELARSAYESGTISAGMLKAVERRLKELQE